MSGCEQACAGRRGKGEEASRHVSQALRVCVYRFRTSFKRRWSGYLAIVILIGAIGGVAMASLAGARRTESSFSELLASTNPSDLSLVSGLYHPDPTGYDPSRIQKIARLPDVTHVESQGGYEAEKVGANGCAVASGLTGGAKSVALYSSIDGLFFNMDRLVVLEGRLPNPQSPTQVAMTAQAARILGVRLGGTFPLGVVSNAQANAPPKTNPSCPQGRPSRTVKVKLVGIVTSSNQIVVDDNDVSLNIFATPAFSKLMLKCCIDPTITSLQISGGPGNVAVVESEISHVLPKGFPQLYTPTGYASEAAAQRVIRPDAIALGVFGLIVALVAFIVAIQLLGRQLRLDADELDVVRALGAGPTVTSLDGLIGVVSSVVLGSLFAALVAFLLSPLAPIGPVRPVYPTPGWDFDALVLWLGVLVLIAVLTGVAFVISFRRAPHRIAQRRVRTTKRPSMSVKAAMVANLPASAVCGIRFALVPGDSRQSTPVRSAVIGAVVAVSVVAATLTFSSSLTTLVSRPALYGWNWTVGVAAAGGVGVMPEKKTTSELNGDPDVLAWSGVDFAQLQIDGQAVPVLGIRPGAKVTPPLLSGHGVRRRGQIVLGPQTLSQLHKRVGETVTVSGEGAKATTLRVVGTATFPAVGGQQHTSLGTGALLDYTLIPKSARNLFDLPGGGPNAVFVRLKTPTSPAAMARLRTIVPVLEKAAQDEIAIVPVQRPAEVTDAGTLRATPSYLALALAAGAILALGLALIASVRRRRRDLALLKALGFTQRQLAAAVAWQATVAAVIGLAIGIPVGVLIGRELWTLFARNINVVPEPSVPALAMTLLALGALVFANVVALLPGRSAARTSAALVLNAD
jgi:ABC-type lipoprotein release transport system permease subunit